MECIATVININMGHNKELLQQCRPLYEYSYFIDLIRNKEGEGYSYQDALELAIAECIQKGILAELLTDHQSEVKRMLLTEYNPKKHIRQEREEAREEGREEGREQGRQEGIERTAVNLLRDGMTTEKVAQLTGLTIERVEKLKSESLQNC